MYMPTSIDFIIDSIGAYNNTSRNYENVSQNIKSPCGICDFPVKHNDNALHCSSCQCLVNIRCNGIPVVECNFRMQRKGNNPDLAEREKWTCLKCIINDRASIFPFGSVSTYELNNQNSVDSLSLTSLIPEILSLN